MVLDSDDDWQPPLTEPTIREYGDDPEKPYNIT